jgi:hypothetical protein
VTIVCKRRPAWIRPPVASSRAFNLEAALSAWDGIHATEISAGHSGERPLDRAWATWAPRLAGCRSARLACAVDAVGSGMDRRAPSVGREDPRRCRARVG